jgi:hypothetical protein
MMKNIKLLKHTIHKKIEVEKYKCGVAAHENATKDTDNSLVTVDISINT